MLARSNLIYAVICHMRGNREGGSRDSLLQLWGRVDGAPNRQPEQRSCYFLYFRFVFIGEKAKKRKTSGLKPMKKKLDLWVPSL